MEKLGLMKSEKMGEYEKEQGKASYKTIVDYFIGNIVLCNNIANIDESVFCNMDIIENEDDEESYQEIYQYYLCNVGSYDKQCAQKAGLIFSYSDMLDCDILCVDHYGTSWDYVLTNVKLFDDYEELKKYEESEDVE